MIELTWRRLISTVISVITPVYQGENFIECCIKTVIDQGCSHVEHIIVDGGSHDRTVQIIRRYVGEYPHIRWISEKDKGQSDAMNKGISMANGKILGILNVDDFYEPNVLNRVSEIFANLPEPSLVVGNCNVWDEKGNLILVNRPKNLKLTDLLLGMKVNNFPLNPSAYFYHASLHREIGLYELDDHYSMDLDFLLRAVQAANVKYIDENWGNFRYLPGTKTFQDCKNGRHPHRMGQLMTDYWKGLSSTQKWELTIKQRSYDYKKRIRGFLGRAMKRSHTISN